jgi:hypothetical protein
MTSLHGDEFAIRLHPAPRGTVSPRTAAWPRFGWGPARQALRDPRRQPGRPAPASPPFHVKRVATPRVRTSAAVGSLPRGRAESGGAPAPAGWAPLCPRSTAGPWTSRARNAVAPLRLRHPDFSRLSRGRRLGTSSSLQFSSTTAAASISGVRPRPAAPRAGDARRAPFDEPRSARWRLRAGWRGGRPKPQRSRRARLPAPPFRLASPRRVTPAEPIVVTPCGPRSWKRAPVAAPRGLDCGFLRAFRPTYPTGRQQSGEVVSRETRFGRARFHRGHAFAGPGETGPARCLQLLEKRGDRGEVVAASLGERPRRCPGGFPCGLALLGLGVLLCPSTNSYAGEATLLPRNTYSATRRRTCAQRRKWRLRCSAALSSMPRAMTIWDCRA